MRLLILTQTIDADDATLGFFHSWVEAFAKETEKVTVVALGVGLYTFPQNVEVLSLGKEKHTSKLRRVVRFYWYIWKERKNYDGVFVHMNPEYVVLGGPLWKLLNKKIILWYSHRSVDTKLRLAERLSDVVVSATVEGFRLPSRKLITLGHGIDTKALRLQSPDFSLPLVITHVGRITKIKHIDLVLRSVRDLIDRGVAVKTLELVGEAVTLEDKGYKMFLDGLASTLRLEGVLVWTGGVPNARMSEVYARAAITINAAPDGGMDKSVLESLAASRPAFVSNIAFKEMFDMYWTQFSYAEGSAASLAAKIEAFLNLPESGRRTALQQLADKMRVEYDIEALVRGILNLFK